MKATLKFDLPEEQQEFEDCKNGGDWRGVVTEIWDYLRLEMKHGTLSLEEIRANEALRQRIADALEDRNLRV